MGGETLVSFYVKYRGQRVYYNRIIYRFNFVFIKHIFKLSNMLLEIICIYTQIM